MDGLFFFCSHFPPSDFNFFYLQFHLFFLSQKSILEICVHAIITRNGNNSRKTSLKNPWAVILSSSLASINKHKMLTWKKELFLRFLFFSLKLFFHTNKCGPPFTVKFHIFFFSKITPLLL